MRALLQNLQLISYFLHPELNVAESGFWEGVTLVLHSLRLEEAVKGVLGLPALPLPASGGVLLQNVI